MAAYLIEATSSDSFRFFKKIMFGGVGIARVAAGLVSGDPDRAFDISSSEI